jgi:altronate hydrolase
MKKELGIKIHGKDNVAVAIAPIPGGSEISISGTDITLAENIPQGHKFALLPIKKGETILKYGNPIGTASRDIQQGEWVHTHNIKTTLGEVLEYTYEKCTDFIMSKEDAFFQGFVRENGRAGVRNEIWVIPTVGCVNNVAEKIALLAKEYVKGTVDEAVAFPHPYGCSQLGEDQENTRKILADLVQHPNAGGVLVLGLGCENSGIEELKKYIGPYEEKRVKFLSAQDCEDEVAQGLELVKELIEYASGFVREPVHVKELVIGMKCGGSDGLSGITANPAVGGFSDLLIAKGGTTILTEVPEMFGAETLLMNRCENREVFDKTVELINDFKNYFTSHNQTIYENPSPGNKKGGISTLEDKSLGCTQKSGSAPVRDVLKYGDIVKKKGLNLLSAPGNDMVAATSLAAAGAQIVLFTTGRGTPFASPVPTVKLSSNTQLMDKKKNWIDFNCGDIVEGKDMESLWRELFEYVLSVASGKKVKSELAGYHDMAIFKQGVTL